MSLVRRSSNDAITIAAFIMVDSCPMKLLMQTEPELVYRYNKLCPTYFRCWLRKGCPDLSFFEPVATILYGMREVNPADRDEQGWSTFQTEKGPARCLERKLGS
jgi:hypothetical protein